MDLEEDAEIDEQMPTVDLDGHLCRFQEILNQRIQNDLMLSRGPLVDGSTLLILILRDQPSDERIEKVPARLSILEPCARFLRLHGSSELRLIAHAECDNA